MGYLATSVRSAWEDCGSSVPDHMLMGCSTSVVPREDGVKCNYAVCIRRLDSSKESIVKTAFSSSTDTTRMSSDVAGLSVDE